MTIGYKTKRNINGNRKRLVVNHDTKMYSFDEYWSDIDIEVRAKELKALETRLIHNGYKMLEEV
nr:MAG TPA: hypothetical protein [Bacteriophage sp.]